MQSAVEKIEDGVKASDEQIKQMVYRFLGWKLPADFSPDAGIKFDARTGAIHHGPTGTNLFSAEQAEAMIRHILAQPSNKEATDQCSSIIDQGQEVDRYTGKPKQ